MLCTGTQNQTRADIPQGARPLRGIIPWGYLREDTGCQLSCADCSEPRCCSCCRSTAPAVDLLRGGGGGGRCERIRQHLQQLQSLGKNVYQGVLQQLFAFVSHPTTSSDIPFRPPFALQRLFLRSICLGILRLCLHTHTAWRTPSMRRSMRRSTSAEDCRCRVPDAAVKRRR